MVCQNMPSIDDRFLALLDDLIERLQKWHGHA
jgi:hypothetical protein